MKIIYRILWILGFILASLVTVIFGTVKFIFVGGEWDECLDYFLNPIADNLDKLINR